ncbi:MAG: RNA polymerase subunit sigma-54 [Hyphomicrobiales bacterium]|nr:MAG: RNA polymerase subunit sigma-54 [Hyphomicrobiales bacterium]
MSAPVPASPVLRALAWMAGAALSLALSAVLIRMAAQRLDPFVVVFFRALFGLLIITPLMFWPRRISFRSPVPKLLVLRGATAFLTMATWFHALALLPTAEAVSLNFTAPLFVTLLAALFLGERIRWRRIAAIIAGMGGILIILQPGFETVLPAHFLPLLAALFMACGGVLVRRLVHDHHPNALIFYTNIAVFPLVTPFALMHWSSPSGMEWLFLLAIGATTTLTHQCLARAYRAAEAGLVAGLSFLRLPTAALAAWLVFNEWPGGNVWLGAAVIIGANILLARREASAARAEALDRI